MRIGLGLPSTIPGTSAETVLEWARLADRGPFSSVGVFDRLVYDSLEPLTVLAAAAVVTTRVELVSAIVNAPLHSTAMLGKAAATIDALSRGRLVLGLAIGARDEDYEIAHVPHTDRGRRFSDQLADLRAQWEDERIGPRPARTGGPPILVGGNSDETFARVARYVDGYIHGGGPPRAFARAADRARAAWTDVGRPGAPRLYAQGYFALGSDAAAEAGADYLRHYYAFTGPFAERIAAGLLTTPQAVGQFVRGYEDAGCDELILFPGVAAAEQIERLTEALPASARTAARAPSVPASS